jgi:RNA polymerase sigma factor (sigma-70 family)
MDERGARLVLHAAKSMFPSRSRSDITMNDLISWGNEGLVRAARKYDPEVAGLTVYAWWWVRKMIQKGMAEHCGYHANSPSWMRQVHNTQYVDEESSGECEDKGRDLRQEVWRKVFQLEERYRTPIVFKYYYGLTVPVIAEVMEIGEREVRNAIKAGINCLRKQYAEKAA